jgi:hypothetical protein
MSGESASPARVRDRCEAHSRTAAGFEKAWTSGSQALYGDQVPSDALAWEPADITIKGAAFKDPSMSS